MISSSFNSENLTAANIYFIHINLLLKNTPKKHFQTEIIATHIYPHTENSSCAVCAFCH